jgi:peptidase E
LCWWGVVLVFDWTARQVGIARKYRKILADYFGDLGASAVEFAELSDSLREIDERVRRSDLVYLPGRDARILIERMRKAGVAELLRKYGKVIVGNSAGAIALCKRVPYLRSS